MIGQVSTTRRSARSSTATDACSISTSRTRSPSQIFTEDAIDDRGRIPVPVGRVAIEQMFTRALKQFAATAHVISSVEIELDGDEATSSTYVTAWHWNAGGPEDSDGCHGATGRLRPDRDLQRPTSPNGRRLANRAPHDPAPRRRRLGDGRDARIDPWLRGSAYSGLNGSGVSLWPESLSSGPSIRSQAAPMIVSVSMP